MTNRLEMMKCLITGALESEAAATTDAMRTYYRGKVMGVLEVAINGVISRTEHKKIYEHFTSEKDRLL